MYSFPFAAYEWTDLGEGMKKSAQSDFYLCLYKQGVERVYRSHNMVGWLVGQSLSKDFD